MKLILHQALKDLRAQRWLVAAWAIVLASLCAIESLKLDVHFVPPGPMTQLGGPVLYPGGRWLVYVLGSLVLARVLLTWVLTIAFVHSDPVDGSTDAFWMTRPVSSKMLLASKTALIVGLLIVVPAAAATIAFAANGVPWSSLPLAVMQWAMFEALFIVPIALLAAMTRDVARMVLTVIAAGCSCVVALALGLRGLSTASDPFRDPLPWVVLALILLAGSGALVVLQYVTRRTLRTAVGFGALLLAVVTGVALWPLRAAMDESRLASPEWSDSGQVSMSLPTDSVRVETSSYYSNARMQAACWIVGGVRSSGLPRDVVLRIVVAAARLQVSGHEAARMTDAYTYDFGNPAGDLTDPSGRANFERVVDARLLTTAQPTRMGNGLRMWRAVKPELYRQYEGRPATYEARLNMEALQVGDVKALPLRVGSSATADGVETTIVGIGRDRYSRWIVFRRASPRSWFPQASNRVEFVLRNRRRGEAFILWKGLTERTTSRMTPTFLVATDGVARFDAPSPDGPGDDAWLQDAELVLVPLRSLGRFDKTITIPQLILPMLDVTPQR